MRHELQQIEGISPEFSDSECYTGNHLVLDFLRQNGVSFCSGITGGGVVHFLQHLASMDELDIATPRFFPVQEYVAGFVPLGAYLGGNQLGACVATTGAATKLLMCALSDAKLHRIPAIFIVPISPARYHTLAPLQDTTEHGSNIIAQLFAELPDGIFTLDSPNTLVAKLRSAAYRLQQREPIVLVLEPEILRTELGSDARGSLIYNVDEPNKPSDLTDFIHAFRQACVGHRVTLLIGEELCHVQGATAAITAISCLLKAAVLWSINGANSVERSNPQGYGYLGFGGNDFAQAHWASLNANDILLVIGASPDEYTVNLQEFPAGHTFYLTDSTQVYCQHEGGYRHRSRHAYSHCVAPLDHAMFALRDSLEVNPPVTKPVPPAPLSLNDRMLPLPRPGCVDLVQLFTQLDSSWRPGTIGFDDICLAYKDRQYVTQRPNPYARFFSLYRGSAMGGAFGLAIGAKLVNPRSDVVCLSGDGCFRLYGGALPEAANLGLLLLLFDNGNFGIVEQGLPIILPGVPAGRRHSTLAQIDYVSVARASGWAADSLDPDISNLAEILHNHRVNSQRSMLVRIPVDTEQVVGQNPRARNL
ncbi:thiamine pyrophosphate-dependent enzyme [Burkholderia latens]|uniref:thiamine pyrophosphate-dependent enzyme n=1 Tax=Burkholderia latens TaxID=488446 RepID=UPI001AEAA16A|nr:thiamine pyrophosphate-dependent enzyme [Burkholderia latens]MBR7964622.1 thiamine pyrophosphate-binding protein [Burkholderia vietnamiensis]QTO46936.1 thiamine pyrophosphate-binding protein [Burkholderia latens]